MTLKKWMQGKGNDARTQGARLRTPTAMGDVRGDDASEPRFTTFGRAGAGASVGVDPPVHLGPYAPLIGAIREELEQFVTNQLRLHLAIAERDRYVLSSIEVECDDGDAERDLMRRFTREFRPEQIKQYLAKEIIAGLRNASAIDLSQFAGLNAALHVDPPDEQDEYGQRYHLDFKMARGSKEAIVRTCWIIRTNEDFPRLTNCYVLTKGGEE